MDYQEAKDRFIQSWGNLGSSWGINRTMAQIHALLLISPKPLSTDDLMAELNISRGNANMNTRALIDWGLVEKDYIPGDRKEYFSANKDFWEIARQVARERKKRELEPLLATMNQLKEVKDKQSPELAEFQKVTEELNKFSQKADGFLDKMIRSDKNWFFKVLMKIFK